MIKFENVSKVYPNGTRGLEDINLEIEQGEFVGIIGTSGAGKSTLIRTINALNNITAGTLIVNDTDVAKLKGKGLREFRKHVGMIFQSYHVFLLSVMSSALVCLICLFLKSVLVSFLKRINSKPLMP